MSHIWREQAGKVLGVVLALAFTGPALVRADDCNRLWLSTFSLSGDQGVHRRTAQHLFQARVWQADHQSMQPTQLGLLSTLLDPLALAARLATLPSSAPGDIGISPWATRHSCTTECSDPAQVNLNTCCRRPVLWNDK